MSYDAARQYCRIDAVGGCDKISRKGKKIACELSIPASDKSRASSGVTRFDPFLEAY
jgi:hypothetical protein